MIAKIIPKIKLPLGANAVFDYLVPNELENKLAVGQIVEVEFRNRKTQGMVLEIKKLGETIIKLKPIIKILDEKPILYPRQIETMHWIADYYYAPVSLVLRTLVPDVLSQKSKVKSLKPKVGGDKVKLKILKSRFGEVKRAIDKIIKSEKNVLFYWSDLREKTLVYLKLIEYYLKKGQQVLIILPQITDVEFLADFLKNFGSKLVILHAELPKSVEYANWVKVRNNQAKIILGTKSAVLAPLKNPGLIIIDDDASSDHKQSDMNPRYDCRKIAEKSDCKILLSSSAPRVESYYRAKIGQLKLIELTHQPRYSLITVNLANELLQNNYSPISAKLEEEIINALNKNQKIILFLNRKGTSTMTVCRDCHFIFRCQRCHLPLAYHESEKQMICHHCGFKEATSLACSSCHGTNLKFIGTGTQKVEVEIRKRFPNKKIIRIDSDTRYYQLAIADYDIVIGTQILLKLFPILNNISLVGVISADNLLSRPDFRSGEKTYGLINKILVWSGFNKAEKVVIQSYALENSAIKHALLSDYFNFYQPEIELRNQLGYPPFIKFIKLIYKSPTSESAQREATRASASFQSTKNIAKIGPLAPYQSRIGKWHLRIIILKTPPGFNLPPTFIPANWLVDVEPEEMI